MLRALIFAVFFFLIAPGYPLMRLVDPNAAPSAPEPMPGEREVKALAATWPDRIAETALRNGDWALRIGDAWFAWANGRLMPESVASRWAEFVALPFYPYPITLPPLAVIGEQDAALLRKKVRDDEANPPRRSEEFLGALLQAPNRIATEARLKRMEVAGFTVTVHERLVGPLTRASDELRSLRAADPKVAAFLRGLAEMNGYNYRYVEGTRSRSLHSYGLAVDLIPKSYGGKDSYWMWAMMRHPDWWAVPYDQRWMPPSSVIEAFERQGFVWGGKWLFFDTMHFEFRPDLLLMAREYPAAAATAAAPQS